MDATANGARKASRPLAADNGSAPPLPMMQTAHSRDRSGTVGLETVWKVPIGLDDLHEANPSIPVLVMTALEDAAIHEHMLRAGAAEVLPKDIPFREVIAAVRRLGDQG
jgi:CheY-like chemotaxis protein